MVDPQGEVCPECGLRGCLESIISISGIAKVANELGLSFPENATHDEIFGRLVELDYGKNRQVEECLKRVARLLGNAITDFVNVLNPEVVILGGRVIWACPRLVEMVEQVVIGECWPYSKQGLRIVGADQLKHPSLIGAVTLVKEYVFMPEGIVSNSNMSLFSSEEKVKNDKTIDNG